MISVTTGASAITRRSALGLVTAAACALPALPGRAAEPDPASAGPLEVVSYEEACAAVEEFVRTIEPAPADAPVVERLLGNAYRQRPGEVNGIRPIAE